MSNYPDGMSGREFDTCEVDCECPKCGTQWSQEVSSQWGIPEEVELECEDCGYEFVARNSRY